MRRGLEFKKKARIIIVDDNYDHLSGIKELIEIESDFDVVATATSASVAISLIKKYRPEIVLMDINMPEKDGLTAIAEIEKLDLGVRTIALTGYDDPDLIFRAMKIGAKGYILKTMASAQLIYAIDEVANGKIYLPAALSSRFFEYFQKSFKEEVQAVSDEDNLLNYLSLDNVAACGASWLAPQELIKGGNFDEITRRCKNARALADETCIRKRREIR